MGINSGDGAARSWGREEVAVALVLAGGAVLHLLQLGGDEEEQQQVGDTGSNKLRWRAAMPAWPRRRPWWSSNRERKGKNARLLSYVRGVRDLIPLAFLHPGPSLFLLFSQVDPFLLTSALAFFFP